MSMFEKYALLLDDKLEDKENKKNMLSRSLSLKALKQISQQYVENEKNFNSKYKQQIRRSSEIVQETNSDKDIESNYITLNQKVRQSITSFDKLPVIEEAPTPLSEE